jgi:hypothetical protein
MHDYRDFEPGSPLKSYLRAFGIEAGRSRPVVDAEVYVRVRVRLPAGPRAAQGHRDHPRHVTEPFCDIFRQADRGLQPVPLRILRRQLRMRTYPGAVLAIPDTRKVRWRGQVYEGPHVRGFYTWPETLRSCCTAPSTAPRQSSAVKEAVGDAELLKASFAGTATPGYPGSSR